MTIEKLVMGLTETVRFFFFGLVETSGVKRIRNISEKKENLLTNRTETVR